MKTLKILAIIASILLTSTFSGTLSAQGNVTQASGTISIKNEQYHNQFVQTWNINTGILNSAIRFDYNVSTEDTYDYVYIYELDESGNRVQQIIALCGQISGSITAIIPSGKAQVEFSADREVSYADGATALWGFEVNYNSITGDNSTTSLNVLNDAYIGGSLETRGSISAGIYKMKMMDFPGHASWIDMPAIPGKASGIGSGGAGQNAWIGYASGTNQWFGGAAAGDICYRNRDGRLLFGNTSGYPAMTITGDNIGIGTMNPDTKLTVNGKIHATEVIVDLAIPADYVFKPTYKLMPLHEVEKYVKTNSHLPEIPSAGEIIKNGLSMGEMQNKLLQKVEELTLYVIEQQKEINLLKQKLKTENQ